MFERVQTNQRKREKEEIKAGDEVRRFFFIFQFILIYVLLVPCHLLRYRVRCGNHVRTLLSSSLHSDDV